MTAALGEAVSNEEPIVVTGWAPHWMFGRWDLKILDDPENVFGESETINTIVRQGLEDDQPELYRFFDEMDWFSVENGIASVMVMIADQGMNPEEAAAQWVDNNQAAVNNALPSDMSL